jgi:hypothetical protein
VSGDLPDPAAVWWDRVRRAAKAKGAEGSKIMSDWSHDMIDVFAPDTLDLVGPFGHRRWEPTPAERFTEEYISREVTRLTDELGVALGVGKRPGPPMTVSQDWSAAHAELAGTWGSE